MIRPFQPGDIYLIQRLGRQATQLPCTQSFLQPQSSTSAALSAVLPWTVMKASTYVLRQEGHGLVHDGFLQVARRPNRPEAEILCVAPSLDAPTGHPAIWNKLLSHFAQRATSMGFERIYADVPDQPLLVSTFAGVGFQSFCRQTIWRCYAPDASIGADSIGSAYTRSARDDWALMRLYFATVPEPVRTAEGASGLTGAAAPILENLRPDTGVTCTVRIAGELVGAFQLLHGPRGVWLKFWADTLKPDNHHLRALIGHALAVVVEHRWPTPVYVASSDYHGGLDPLLDAFGFAPFLNRVRMVKHVVKWVRESVTNAVPVVESTSEVVPTSFAPPSAAPQSIHSATTVD